VVGVWAGSGAAEAGMVGRHGPAQNRGGGTLTCGARGHSAGS
jgi:hypothetical protein